MLALCLSLPPFLLFLSVPSLSVCVIPPCFGEKGMVVDVLAKGLLIWDFRCYGVSLYECHKMGQIVLKVVSDQKGVQVATRDNTRTKMFIMKKKNKKLNCPRVVNHHPPV